jgi:hypothetical protein
MSVLRKIALGIAMIILLMMVLALLYGIYLSAKMLSGESPKFEISLLKNKGEWSSLKQGVGKILPSMPNMS